MTPSPPIWMRNRMTTCPNILHAVAVGNVTRPVTQVAVVAVNNASMYDTATPSRALIGSANNTLPQRIVIRKLIMITCVVDNPLFFLLIISNLFSHRSKLFATILAQIRPDGNITRKRHHTSPVP